MSTKQEEKPARLYRMSRKKRKIRRRRPAVLFAET